MRCLSSFPQVSIVKGSFHYTGQDGAGLEEYFSSLQYPGLENFMNRGACQATVHRVAKSWTWLSVHGYTHTHMPLFLQKEESLIILERWDERPQAKHCPVFLIDCFCLQLLPPHIRLQGRASSPAPTPLKSQSPRGGSDSLGIPALTRWVNEIQEKIKTHVSYVELGPRWVHHSSSVDYTVDIIYRSLYGFLGLFSELLLIVTLSINLGASGSANI